MTTKPTEHPHARIYSTARNCWPGLTIASFSLHTSERDVFLRRICMIGIISLHTLVSILVIVAVAFRFSNVPRIIFAILGFFCMAYALSLIDRMRGERRVFGSIYNRWHFDAFLCVLFLWYLFLVGWYFAGIHSDVLYDVWWALYWMGDLVLWGLAWVAWWSPTSMV